jgi:hypothetical protein
MSNHTAQDLLAAVGVTEATHDHLFVLEASAETGWKIQPIYTGPALGTPELDAILWVEGQRWCRDCEAKEYHAMSDRICANWLTEDPADYLLIMHNPGHALAAAIKEVKS